MDRATVILLAIAAVAGLFGLLLGTIVCLKLHRGWRTRRIRRRRERLMPLVLRYVQAAEGSLVDLLPGPPRRLDREVLREVLLERVEAVRGRLRERLVRAFEDLGLVEEQTEALRSSRPWARAEAAENLGQMRSERAADPLIQAMDDPAAEVRLRAARALGRIRGTAATTKLVAALAEPNRWSAMRIADILAGMGEPAVEALVDRIDRVPHGSRLLILDIFGRVRSLRAIPVLRERLRDADPDVRARAAHALGQIGDPGSAGALVSALSDPAWPVRAMAAKALGRISGTEGVDPLTRALEDPQWWVRANAAEALKGKGEAGQRALVSLLDSADAYAREQAVLMLQESGVLDQWIARLVSPAEEERRTAETVIRRLVAIRRTDLLRQMAEEHPDPQVRQGLGRLLGPLAPAASRGA